MRIGNVVVAGSIALTLLAVAAPAVAGPGGGGSTTTCRKNCTAPTSPSPSPSPSPSSAPSPSLSPSPSPTVASPAPSPTASVSPSPTASPSPTTSPSPSASPASSPATSPSATPVSATCRDGKTVLDQLTTPEGASIKVCTTSGGWTADAIYALLKPNALNLVTIGRGLTVEVQTTYGTSAATSASYVPSTGTYNVKATVYLNSGASQSFTTRPEAILTHEYGHVWTQYWRYNNPANGLTFDRYLQARGLAGDPRIDSSYNWSTSEMVADDYRRLFGTPKAQSDMSFINPDVPDSHQVPGLATFFRDSFAVPGAA